LVLQDLGHQLVRDLKASWKKTAALGLLLLVGLVIWIPMLLGAIGFGEEAPPGPAALEAPETGPVQPVAPAARPQQAVKTAESRELNWQQLRAALSTDPLLRPADIATIPANPFTIDNDQFPPPDLFADSEADGALTPRLPEVAPPPVSAAPREAPEGLELTSTVVGAKRRAALLNGSLCFEGGTLVVNDVEYRIVTVRPDDVVLDDGEGEFVLEIMKPGRKGNVEILPAGR
jgi:hypothetical protein